MIVQPGKNPEENGKDGIDDHVCSDNVKLFHLITYTIKLFYYDTYRNVVCHHLGLREYGA